VAGETDAYVNTLISPQTHFRASFRGDRRFAGVGGHAYPPGIMRPTSSAAGPRTSFDSVAGRAVRPVSSFCVRVADTPGDVVDTLREHRDGNIRLAVLAPNDGCRSEPSPSPAMVPD
jgi:hypothetical protein